MGYDGIGEGGGLGRRALLGGVNADSNCLFTALAISFGSSITQSLSLNQVTECLPGLWAEAYKSVLDLTCLLLL